ncbi:MAG: ArsC/Spx/MgsR family protein [Rhodopila sp.]|jgi:nitrogenase-associated protein
MATVIFYEKPGCATNARQKRLLAASGHTIEARSLLTELWTAARLGSFFGETPVQSWFNPAAPAVKSGTIDPAAVDATAAIALMLANPLLIKRPLFEVDGKRQTGFDPDRIRAWIGLNPPSEGAADPVGCSRPTSAGPCPNPSQPIEPRH